jgi:hypothetical protein
MPEYAWRDTHYPPEIIFGCPFVFHYVPNQSTYLLFPTRER